VFLLAILMVIDLYKSRGQESGAEQGIISGLVAILRQTIRQVTEESILRLWGRAARELVLRVGTAMVASLMRRNESSSVVNVRELVLYFEQEEAIRQQTIQALEYLNRDHPGLGQVPDVFLSLHRTNDQVSRTLADLILDSNGVHWPEMARAALERLVAELPDRDCFSLCEAAHRWYSIVDRKPDYEVTEADLQMMCSVVTRWMGIDVRPLCKTDPDQERLYGHIVSHGRPYPYYPLAYYTAMWTKAYPGEPVDLLEHYTRQAERENDLALKLHIIDTFSDFRQEFYDYATSLRVLTPYIQSLSEPVSSESEHADRRRTWEHLVNALGRLRGLHSEDVDAFLEESDAPEDMIEDICCHSYQQPMIVFYVRFSQFLCDLFAYAPAEFVEQLIAISRDALSTRSLGAMFSVFINRLMDLAETPSARAA
jgi:hypothetical protein